MFFCNIQASGVCGFVEVCVYFFLFQRFRSSVKQNETHFSYLDANENTTNKALSLGRKGSQGVLRNNRGKILLISGRKSE
jgi:hypothetical protein